MIEENTYGINEEMLFRHFDRQLTAGQEETVLAWRDDSEENFQEYQRFHFLYLDIKAVQSLDSLSQDFAVKPAWKKFTKQNEFGVRATGYRWLSIAASIALILGLAWFGYDLNYGVEEVRLASADAVVQQELIDGSTVSLNKNSQLTYPEKFDQDERAVSLVGEAYFEVEPNPEQPFVINAQDVVVQVLGTSFNVKAYEQSDSIIVTVDSGVVSVTFKDQTEVIEAGNRSVFVKSQRVIRTVEVTFSSGHNYWRTKRLNYYGSTLQEIVDSLEEVYEVSIDLENESLATCTVTVSFEDERIENVLDVITATLGLEFEQLGEGFLIKGEGCAQ